MAFNGTEGQAVSLTDASKWTARYRTLNPGAIKGHFMGKDLLNQILSEPGVEGIRVYYGNDEDQDDVPVLVFVGADSNEDDLVNGTIAEKALACPPRCGDSNPLNS